MCLCREQLRFSVATRRSSRSSFTDCNKPQFPSNCFICEKMHISETKRIFWPKKILLIAAEATIKSMARNQMRVVFISKTWILISSLWDHCHHLWYKSITHSNTCSFPKASTMINFENAFSYREILWMDDTFPNEIEKILWETDDEMTLRTQLARLW